MFELTAKVAIVTGGGRGIGHGIALCLAKAGAKVAVNDRDSQPAEEVAKEIKAQGGEAIAVPADVSKRNHVESLIKKTLDAFGKIDILVNNAGVGTEHLGTPLLQNLTEEDWDRCYETNLKAHFFTCKSVIPHMVERRSGRIINISSASGKKGDLAICQYSTMKAGVINFTQGLARELAPYRITVNAICPGVLWTSMFQKTCEIVAESHPLLKGTPPRQVFETAVQGMVPMQTEQTPEDIGWMVVFLASEEANQITGQAISVDGGFEIR